MCGDVARDACRVSRALWLRARATSQLWCAVYAAEPHAEKYPACGWACRRISPKPRSVGAFTFLRWVTSEAHSSCPTGAFERLRDAKSRPRPARGARRPRMALALRSFRGRHAVRAPGESCWLSKLHGTAPVDTRPRGATIVEQPYISAEPTCSSSGTSTATSSTTSSATSSCRLASLAECRSNHASRRR